MRPKLLIAGALATGLLAACASRQPAPVVVATAPVVAAAPANTIARTAQVVAVENSLRTPGSTVPTSGSGAGTVATSESARVTVRFADGTESIYDVQQPVSSFRVGDRVNVISRGSDIVFTR